MREIANQARISSCSHIDQTIQTFYIHWTVAFFFFDRHTIALPLHIRTYTQRHHKMKGIKDEARQGKNEKRKKKTIRWYILRLCVNCMHRPWIESKTSRFVEMKEKTPCSIAQHTMSIQQSVRMYLFIHVQRVWNYRKKEWKEEKKTLRMGLLHVNHTNETSFKILNFVNFIFIIPYFSLSLLWHRHGAHSTQTMLHHSLFAAQFSYHFTFVTLIIFIWYELLYTGFKQCF